MNDSPTQPSILTWKSADRHPRLGALELLLGHRDDVDDAGLEADRDGAARRWRRCRAGCPPPRRRRSRVRRPDRRVDPGGAGQRDTVGGAHVDAAADLVADLEHALRGRRRRPGERAVEDATDDRTPATRSPWSAARSAPAISSLAEIVSVQPSGDFVVAGGGGLDAAVVDRRRRRDRAAGRRPARPARRRRGAGTSGSADGAGRPGATAHRAGAIQRAATYNTAPNAFSTHDAAARPDAGPADLTWEPTCDSRSAANRIRRTGSRRRHASVTRPSSVSPASSG